MPKFKSEFVEQPLIPATDGGSRERCGISICVLLVAAITLLALAMPALLGHVYIADDLGEFHLPIRAFYAKQLAAGQPFEWMPGLFGGFYIAAEGQLGAYHPFHLILYRALPLNIAFNLELLASYPFLFCGTWLFLRRFTGSTPAGLYGALVFTFGSFPLLHFLHPNVIAVIAHIPWLLLAMDIALKTNVRTRQVAAEIGISLIVGSQILLGHPQSVWFTMLAAFGLIAFRYTQVGSPIKRVAMIAAAAGIGVAISAVQWMATLHMLENSTRKAVDISFFNTGSLHPFNLAQLVAPYLFKTRVVGQNTHELGIYVGAVPLVLCVFLLATRNFWGRYHSLVRAMIICGALSLLLAFGEYGGLYRIQSFIPIANRFRFPCRNIVLVQLAVACLAGMTLILLAEKVATSLSKRLSPVFVLLIVVAVAFAITGPILFPKFVSGPFSIMLGPTLIILAVALVNWARRGSPVALYALVIFTAIDLGTYGLSYSVWTKTAKLEQYIATAPRPKGVNSARVVAPSEKDEPTIGDRMLLAGMTRIDGYAGLQAARQLDYSKETTWRLCGAEWAYIKDGESGERKWIAISQTNPRAQLVGNPTTAVDILRDSPGSIAVSLAADASGVLAVTESYDPGWRVKIDGVEQKALRVRGDFLGCHISGGDHLVEFQFRPACRQWGIAISICGLLSLFLLGGFRLFKRES